MNIGIVLNNESNGLTGISKFVDATLEELLPLDKKNQYFCFRGKYKNSNLNKIHILCDSLNEKSYIESYDLTAYIHKIDIIHSFFPPICGMNYSCQKILTIHDMIPLIHPEWYSKELYNYFNILIRESVEEADKIITVSDYTKEQVIEFFNKPIDKVITIYPGLYQKMKYNEKVESEVKYCMSLGDYILFVSTMNPRKNFEGLVEAYITFRERYPLNHTKLVLVGKQGWGNVKINNLFHYEKYSDDIVMTGYVSDERLTHLYVHALSVAYVSFYEGFGLPILEAMAAGKAVICSNVTSMPEVGGDAVEYCNPYEIESILAAMESVILNDTRRKELEHKAIEQAKKFTFYKSAIKIMNIYNDLASKQ